MRHSGGAAGAFGRACPAGRNGPGTRFFYGRRAAASPLGGAAWGRVSWRGKRGTRPHDPGGLSDDATDARLAGLRPAGRGAVAGVGRAGAGPAVHDGPLLLLPLPLLPAQLLAA